MGGSKYRGVVSNPTKPHSLISREKGANRHKVGRYTCSCGEVFETITRFEKHRAEARREEKSAR